jgi:hypothetical protein
MPDPAQDSGNRRSAHRRLVRNAGYGTIAWRDWRAGFTQSLEDLRDVKAQSNA